MFLEGRQAGSFWESALAEPKQGGTSQFLGSFTSATAISIAVGSKNLLRQVRLVLPLGGNDQWHDLWRLLIRMQKIEAGRRMVIPSAVPPLLCRLKQWTCLQAPEKAAG